MDDELKKALLTLREHVEAAAEEVATGLSDEAMDVAILAKSASDEEITIGQCYRVLGGLETLGSALRDVAIEITEGRLGRTGGAGMITKTQPANREADPRLYRCDCVRCADFHPSNRPWRVRDCDRCGNDGTFDHIDYRGRYICGTCMAVMESGGPDDLEEA